MGKKQYIDNRAFTAAMREYQRTLDPDLLSDITTRYLIPLAEAVANNWQYHYSDHSDLTQEALAAGIRAINHPNAASHAFNFFTKVFRNRMLDISRSDANRSQKSRDHLAQWETGYIRQHEPTEHTSTDDIIADCILNGDGTTKTGQASVSKIAAETGIDRQTIESYLAGQKSRLQHLLRPSERTSTEPSLPTIPIQPFKRYAATQTTLAFDTTEPPIRSARETIHKRKRQNTTPKYLGMWGMA